MQHQNRALTTSMFGRNQRTNNNDGSSTETQNLVNTTVDMNANQIPSYTAVHCLPPPAYQSSPSSPAFLHATAPPLSLHSSSELKCIMESEDFFSKIYTSKYLATVVGIAIAIIIFGVVIGLLAGLT